MSFPLIELTQEEWDFMPKASDQPEGFMKYCPLGYRIKNLEKMIMGEVVKFLDAFSDQAGGFMMANPERFVNRYQVKIVA